MLLPGGPLRFLRCIVRSFSFKILKPAEKKAKYPYGANTGRPVTPPRKQKKRGDNKIG